MEEAFVLISTSSNFYFLYFDHVTVKYEKIQISSNVFYSANKFWTSYMRVIISAGLFDRALFVIFARHLFATPVSVSRHTPASALWGTPPALNVKGMWVPCNNFNSFYDLTIYLQYL